MRNIAEKLRQSLENLNLKDAEIRVDPGDYGKVLGTIISPSFEGLDEYDRQILVWDQLLKDMGDDDSSWVEFVFTDAPSDPVGDQDD